MARSSRNHAAAAPSEYLNYLRAKTVSPICRRAYIDTAAVSGLAMRGNHNGCAGPGVAQVAELDSGEGTTQTRVPYELVHTIISILDRLVYSPTLLS